MKKILICLFLFITVMSKSFAADPQLFGVALIAAKNDIMYMRFDHELDGAKVEIYNHDGNLIATHFLKQHRKHKSKLIIDFIEATPGRYTVVVVKSDKFRAFHYTTTNIGNALITSRINNMPSEVRFYELNRFK